MTVGLKNDEFKTYELGYLLSPLVAPDAVAEAVAKEIKSWLTKAEAEVKSEVSPHSRPLAYPIKKVAEHKGSTFRDAYFGAVYFTCRPESLATIESGLKKSTLLVRHLIMILPARAFLPPAKPRVAPATVPVAPKVIRRLTDEAIDKEIENLIHVS